MKTINGNIKLLRKYHDLNQQKFGELFGLTRGMVASYENNIEPSIYTLMKIAKHFDFDLIEFLETNFTEIKEIGQFINQSSYNGDRQNTSIKKPLNWYKVYCNFKEQNLPQVQVLFSTLQAESEDVAKKIMKKNILTQDETREVLELNSIPDSGETVLAID